MGMTANHNLPFPELIDAPNGPEDVQALAEAVDSALDDVIASLPTDGWNALAGAWAFGAADGHTYTMVAAGDHTADVDLGMRVKLTHAAATKFFIVTAKAYAGGNTTLTLYGGTDYVLAAGAITNVYASRAKTPSGFPADPRKWTEELRDTVSRSQASPANGVWYNLGSLSLAIPIGAWDVVLETTIDNAATGGNGNTVLTTLSTSNNAETDADFSSYAYAPAVASVAVNFSATFFKRKLLMLAAKTTYYVLAKTNHANSALALRGDNGPTIVRAICAYL